MPHEWMGWGFGLIGMIWFAVLWGLVLIGLVVLARWIASQTRRQLPAEGPSDQEPIDILKRRYAKGEIDRKEYEQKRHDLE